MSKSTTKITAKGSEANLTKVINGIERVLKYYGVDWTIEWEIETVPRKRRRKSRPRLRRVA